MNPTNPVSQGNPLAHSEHLAWQVRSDELAEWAWQHLVNRTDAWGSYLSLEQRDGPSTAKTAHGELTVGVLDSHFAACDVGDIIGLHAIAPGNTCQWIAIDIDLHGEPEPELVQLNLDAALAWYQKTKALGFDPLLLDSNGGGGFHLLVLFAEPISSQTAFSFGKWLISDWHDLGLGGPQEVFPKQPTLDKIKRFGNWLRLPGLHHTRPFVSRMWSGSAWLTADEAINAILETSGKSGDLIPTEAAEFSKSRLSPRPPGVVNSDDSDRPTFTVLHRLHNVTKHGSGWSACCPAHGDRDPSLTVSEAEDGKVLVHCHAGCDLADIAAAIDLPMQAFFPTSQTVRDGPVSVGYGFTSVEKSNRAQFERERAKHHGDVSNKLVAELAQSLGVSVASLIELGVGWSAEDDCWTFLERDGKGNVIGVMRRFRDNTQRVVLGSTRGLYIPDGLAARSGPVLVVEGSSDTAAATSVGLAAVGRPSASGGAPHLVELLGDDDRKIIVVGEMDAGRSGLWPGMKGAKQVATQLASRLPQSVKWALPPKGVKDIRDWIRKEARDAS
jgi:hypothetical protein